MAHPDHDQVIGRLIGARLRGPAGRLAGQAAAAEVHPDAETWAAYVDGGLLADEVGRLDTHLAGCAACRRLVAGMMPEVSAAAVPVPTAAEVSGAGSGVVLPFPRKQVFVWMGLAAGLFGAVTLWSVSRLGVAPAAMRVADATTTAGSSAPVSAAPARSAVRQAEDGPATAPPTPSAEAPRSAGAPRAVPPPMADASTRMTVGREQDASKADAGRLDAMRKRLAFEEAKVAAAVPPAAAPSAGAAASARAIPSQTNTLAAGAARPRGPLANQQANSQQSSAPQANARQAGPQPQVAAGSAPTPAPAEVAIAPPLPPPAAPAPAVAAAAPAPRPADATAAGGAAVADARERRANEATASEIAEAVTTRGGRAARREAAKPQPGADRDGQARAKDEAAQAFSVGAVSAPALPSFAEPGGRLLWRIADGGRRIESSSDGGTTWNRSHSVRGRLRAGTAPSIDNAWAVGERGLVVRLSVPGGWTAVSPPADVALIAVSATGAQAARVTAADGRVFETADGGATWTSATPGAGPQ